MPGIVTATRQVQPQQPHGPITPNWASPQAQGLIFWAPLSPSWGGRLNLVRASPSGMNGTQQNGFVASTVFKGASQYGLVGPNFDGTDDRLDFAFAQDMASSPITVSAWICTTDNSTAKYVINLGRTSGNLGIELSVTNNPTGGAGLLARSYNGGATTKNAATAAGVISNSVWYHLAATDPATSANGTDITVYVNGIAQASFTTANGTGSPDATTQNWTIGGRAVDNNRNWKGALADVRVYNRCMTASEVYALWNPPTRWDLYWQPSRRVYVFQSTTTRHQWMPLLGVN